jgi:gliding motility-associated lipoprotein GldH
MMKIAGINIRYLSVNKIQGLFLYLMVVSLLISCDKNRIFEEFKSIQKQTWSSNNILHFNASIMDTSLIYNVYISVRNTGNYEYCNLYLFVTTHSPSENSIRDTVEIMLADEHGKWYGKGAASVYTLYYPYKVNIKFPLRGIYTFDIEQAMWIKDLKHINDIGLRIERASKQL